jgi:hypothetical protein
MDTRFPPAEPQPFGVIQDPPGLPLVLGPRRHFAIEPVRPSTAERLSIANRQRRVGIACLALSALTVLYFFTQMMRAVLS